MKLSVRALAIACGALWGGAVLTVGLINLFKPSYGRKFLKTVASVYPVYEANGSGTQVAVGSAIAFADGAISGALAAVVYNAVSGGEESAEVAELFETREVRPA